MNDQLITIGTFNSTINAHIVMGKLESAGIESILVDENVGSLLNILVGGIKLKIRQEDEEEALRILFESEE